MPQLPEKPHSLETIFVIVEIEVVKYLPPANKVWGKVIFSEACVKNSVHREGGLPQCMLGYHHHRPPRPGAGTPWDQALLDQAPQDQAPRPGTPQDQASPQDQATLPPEQSMLGDMVNEWTVHILLECILEKYIFRQAHCQVLYFIRFFSIVLRC